MDLAYVVNTEAVLREAALQNEEFDLFTFLVRGKCQPFNEGACGFITRRQYFYCESPTRHDLVFENVCGSIFDDFKYDVNPYYRIYMKYSSTHKYTGDHGNDDWRYANEEIGVISIQILSKTGVFVWMPEVINSFQKEKLLEFCNEIKKINEYLKSQEISEVKISFVINEKIELSMDELISQIDNFVDDNCFCMEVEQMVTDYLPKREKSI